MKKLYRKGAVHPSQPDNLSFLPATILTLTVALSPEDREVLAYLISCSSSSNFSGNHKRNTKNNNNSSISSGVDHQPSFNCYCFRCYMSYWIRWDSSPNRQLIDEIIEAYEDGLAMQSKKEKSRKDRRKNKGLIQSELNPPSNKEFTESSENSVDVETVVHDDGEEEKEEEEMSKDSSVRRFVSFLGEKIWGVWT